MDDVFRAGSKKNSKRSFWTRENKFQFKKKREEKKTENLLIF